jgi:hypothetical protein
MSIGKLLFAMIFSATIPDESLAQASRATTPESTPSAISSNAVPPAIQEITISGNPSLLRVANPWWGELESPCAVFRVTAIASIETIELYTNGLGRTLLAETSADKGNKCPANLTEHLTLKKEKPGESISRYAAIKVDTSALSTPSATMQGNVVALVGGKKVGEFALKAERPPRDEAWTAATWMLTIVIPAVVTFGATRFATLFTARQKEIDDFRTYRLNNMQQITDFIDNDIRPIIGAPDVQHPGRLIFDLFSGKKEILSKIPDYQSRKLMKAISAGEVKRIARVLKAIFPESGQAL